MPIDRQIFVAGTAAAPLDYSVPNSAEVIPLAIAAVFDGTTAAGSYLPCIEIYSDGGVLIARTIADTAVAAGSSAAVTFAPGLDAAASLALTFDTVPVVASGAGDTQLVAAVPGHRIRVMQVGLMAAGSVGVKFVGGADETGVYPLAANTGFVLGPVPDDRWWFQTSVGSALSINLSAGVNVGGVLGYTLA